MSVFRINKTDNYTVMSNYHLKDKNLSLKGKGLLSLMLSLPPEWDYSIKGLCKIIKENETALKSTLKELKQLRYLNVTKFYPNETNSGHIEYVYDVFEIPNQESPNQPLENLPVESEPVETHRQINTNIINTKEINKENCIVEEENLTTNKNNSAEYRELEDLEINELQKLKQVVLENRDTKNITYREIQKQFQLVDKITYDTPMLCNELIKLKLKKKEVLYGVERNISVDPEVF